MSDEQIISILQNTDWFTLSSPVNYILRWLGWKILTLLANVSNTIESIVNEIYSLNGFFNSEQMNNFIDEMMPIIWVILAISLAFLGLKIIFDREFKVNTVIKNFAVAVSIVVLLPMGMDHMAKMTSVATDGLKTEYKFSANKVLKDNLYDLYYLDSQNFKNKTSKNNIPVDNITSSSIDINEEIDSGEVENKDVFSSKLSTDSSGNISKQELDSIFFGLFSENYYRFNFKFWTPFITLLCTAFTLLISSIKIARIIFELGFVKLFGILNAFADITTGQKTKEIIRCIVSNFVVLFIISVLLKMYLMFSSWTSQSSSATQLVLLIGGSLAVIDGPNIIERVLGIDAGIKSGWSVIAAGYAGAKGLSETLSATSKMIGKTASVTGGVGAGLAGFASGLNDDKKGLSSLSDSEDKLSNNTESLHNNNNESDIKSQNSQENSSKENSNIKSDTNEDLKENINQTNKPNDTVDSKMDNINTSSEQPIEPMSELIKDANNQNSGFDSSDINSSISDINSNFDNKMPPLETENLSDNLNDKNSDKLSDTINNSGNERNNIKADSIHSSIENDTPNTNDLRGNERQTFSDLINNKMQSTKTVQHLQKSYTAGKETGEALKYSLSNQRKHIMNKRKKKK